MYIANFLKALASFSWLLVVGVIVLAVVRAFRNRPLRRAVPITIGVLVFSLVLTTISAGLVFIQPEERGFVKSAVSPNGYREQVLQPGLRWVIPFAENVLPYSIANQTYTMSVAPNEGQVFGDDSIRARTKDGQEVFIDASVIYSIDPGKVVALHIAWQSRYQNELVRPLARGIIRDAASQYGIEEIVSTKRAEFELFITSELSAKLGENNLLLNDFVLRDIHFSEEYAAAVEQKQIAEQQALQALYVVEQKKNEAEQMRQTARGQKDATIIQAEGQAEARLIQAEAEAEALRMLLEVLENNPELLTYQYITKLSPNVQVMFLPGNAPFIFPLPQTSIPE